MPPDRSDPSPPDRHAELRGRTDRLEESIAFLDHRLDQLDDAIRGLGDLIDSVRARVDHVETTLAEARSTAESESAPSGDLIDQVPPHAARAPYDRPERPAGESPPASDPSDQQ